MKRLGIIGHFGGDKTFLDGQTVKTKVLYEELTKRGIDNIFCVDTYYNRINKAKLLIDTVRCILSCDTIIFLLSSPGMKIFLPMLYVAKKLLKRRIFHDVIGGNLADQVKRNPQYVKYLSALDGNWVELKLMKNKLEEMGITNCTVVPNFKTLSSETALKTPTTEGGNRFCMFSRVMAEKGVTDAINSVVEYNSVHDAKVYLDIWGPIENEYKEEFEVLLKENADSVTYGGRIDFRSSVEIISNHIALLFPTQFMEEGCPGTIIDAYTAGLPVISSNWNAAKEMVKDFETGFVYPNDNASNLLEAIEWAIDHKDEMIAMRRNCTLVARHYSSDYVVGRIISEIKK